MKQKLEEIRGWCLIMGVTTSLSATLLLYDIFSYYSKSILELYISLGMFLMLVVIAVVNFCIAHECHIRLKKIW